VLDEIKRIKLTGREPTILGLSQKFHVSRPTIRSHCNAIERKGYMRMEMVEIATRGIPAKLKFTVLEESLAMDIVRKIKDGNDANHKDF
jgi:hypothetical protein